MTTTMNADRILKNFHAAQAAFHVPGAARELARMANVSEDEATQIVSRVLATTDAQLFTLLERCEPKQGDTRGRLDVSDCSQHVRAGVRAAWILEASSAAGHLGRAYALGYGIGSLINAGFDYATNGSRSLGTLIYDLVNSD